MEKTIPRNTSEQILLKKKYVKDVDDLKRGCVVFWKGHVAIMIDKFNCIHANAFHMQTKIEPLNQIINRLSKDFNIIKMAFQTFHHKRILITKVSSKTFTCLNYIF